ncbi:MAG: hypothetical protein M3Y75_08440 [Actinomycetota bacterium]|nr:hypothetical protein [Actinomycetota bacterium]
MRIRLPSALALTALATAALTFPAATGAVKVPNVVKEAKVTQYPVKIDAVGYLDHTWTWDSTSSCVPGYAKTIEEELTFELGRPQAAKVTIVNGKVVLTQVTGGDATVRTELSGWQTSNYCPPTEPEPEPPEPVCTKRMKSKVAVGVVPAREEGSDDDPAPLVHQTQVLIYRSKATPQTSSCLQRRPKIEAESEASKGWLADPYAGIVAPLKATDVQFRKLRVGETLRRTVTISGGCRKASFSASASVSPWIRSCVVKGKVVLMVKRTGNGFG